MPLGWEQFSGLMSLLRASASFRDEIVLKNCTKC